MSGWREDISEELQAFGLGELDGDTITVTCRSDGEMTDTKHGDAFRLHVSVEESPDNYEDMSDNPLEEGEDYYLMSSSNRFLSNLSEISDDLTGETITITGEGQGFDRTYTVESA